MGPGTACRVAVALATLASIKRETPPRDRQAFATAMAQVKEGMPAARVEDLLGKPDDVRTAADPGRLTNETREIWCYGTRGHLTFPTLGTVTIDVRGRAQWISGGRGKPPPPSLLPEEELDRLLRLLSKAPALAGSSFDPRPVIEIVNALQAVGKDKALAAIDEFLRVAGDNEGLFVVLRVLFDVPPEGFMPRMGVGAPFPREPQDPKVIPRFPVALVDDVPFLVVSGYMLAGMAEPVADHVRFFRERGQMRAKPLRPTDAVLGLVDKVPLAPRPMVISQWLALVDSVHRVPPDAYGVRFDELPGWEKRWETIRAVFQKLVVHWDVNRQRYVFRDGSMLPEPERTAFRRETWQVKLGRWRRDVIVERRTPTAVSVYVEWTQAEGTVLETRRKPDGELATPILTARTAGPAGVSKALSVHQDGLGSSGGTGHAIEAQAFYIVQLPAGTSMRIKLAWDGESHESPIFVP